MTVYAKLNRARVEILNASVAYRELGMFNKANQMVRDADSIQRVILNLSVEEAGQEWKRGNYKLPAPLVHGGITE